MYVTPEKGRSLTSIIEDEQHNSIDSKASGTSPLPSVNKSKSRGAVTPAPSTDDASDREHSTAHRATCQRLRPCFRQCPNTHDQELQVRLPPYARISEWTADVITTGHSSLSLPLPHLQRAYDVDLLADMGPHGLPTQVASLILSRGLQTGTFSNNCQILSHLSSCHSDDQ